MLSIIPLDVLFIHVNIQSFSDLSKVLASTTSSVDGFQILNSRCLKNLFYFFVWNRRYQTHSVLYSECGQQAPHQPNLQGQWQLQTAISCKSSSDSWASSHRVNSGRSSVHKVRRLCQCLPPATDGHLYWAPEHLESVAGPSLCYPCPQIHLPSRRPVGWIEWVLQVISGAQTIWHP